MKSRSMIRIVMAFCLALMVSTVVEGQTKNRLKREADQSERAANIFREIMDTADQGIPLELLGATECVAVFPSVIKTGFTFSGSGGLGVASCRAASGWSAPAFFNLEGGGFGRQVGEQSTDLVLLFMNKQGLDRLLSNKFEIGADTSAAAGPVGWQVEASKVFDFDAHILAYSRRHGILAGVELKGAIVSPKKEWMRNLYGHGVTVEDILKEKRADVPAAVLVFPITLERYSSRIPD